MDEKDSQPMLLIMPYMLELLHLHYQMRFAYTRFYVWDLLQTDLFYIWHYYILQLVSQLKLGGRLVVPIGPPRGHQYLELVDKNMDGSVTRQRLMGVAYVPLTDKDQQYPDKFVCVINTLSCISGLKNTIFSRGSGEAEIFYWSFIFFSSTTNSISSIKIATILVKLVETEQGC